MRNRKPAIFLDRDGTILNERGYLGDPNDIVFYRNAYPALVRLSRAGFVLVIVTNQSGIARGYFTVADFKRVHARFEKMLERRGVRIAGVYFCPHGPKEGCVCRKPKTALIRRAVKDLNIDLKRSFMVGDQLRDVETARNLRIPGVMVLTGAGRSLMREGRRVATKITSNLDTASRWILSRSQFR